MDEHGLAASFFVPSTWTIQPVPFNVPGMERDPRVRTELLCESIERLVMFDTWHSWCEPGLHESLRRYGSRINSVHVNDVRPVERSNFDRVLPGEGGRSRRRSWPR